MTAKPGRPPVADETERLRAAVSDLLWAGVARPSCQSGLLLKCMCWPCAAARARSALAAQHPE